MVWLWFRAKPEDCNSGILQLHFSPDCTPPGQSDPCAWSRPLVHLCNPCNCNARNFFATIFHRRTLNTRRGTSSEEITWRRPSLSDHGRSFWIHGRGKIWANLLLRQSSQFLITLLFAAAVHLCLFLSSVYRPNVLSRIAEKYRSSHLCNALRLIIAQFFLLNSSAKNEGSGAKKLRNCTILSRFWSGPTVSLKNIIKVIVIFGIFLQMLSHGGSSISSKSPINKAVRLLPIH